LIQSFNLTDLVGAEKQNENLLKSEKNDIQEKKPNEILPMEVNNAPIDKESEEDMGFGLFD
jgi:hypothetical protein